MYKFKRLEQPLYNSANYTLSMAKYNLMQSKRLTNNQLISSFRVALGFLKHVCIEMYDSQLFLVSIYERELVKRGLKEYREVEAIHGIIKIFK